MMIKKIKQDINALKKEWDKIKLTKYYEEKNDLFTGDMRRYSDDSRILDIALRDYLIYLNKPNENINWMRIGFINTYCDWDCTDYDKLIYTIDSNGLYKDEYEEEIPVLIDVFIGADNEMFNKKNQVTTYSFDLINVYKTIAQCYLECDGGKVKPDEFNRAQTYIQNIYNYIQKNLNINAINLYCSDGTKGLSMDNVEYEDDVLAPKKTEKGSNLVKLLNEKLNENYINLTYESQSIDKKRHTNDYANNQQEDIIGYWKIIMKIAEQMDIRNKAGIKDSMDIMLSRLTVLYLLECANVEKVNSLDKKAKEFLKEIAMGKRLDSHIKKGKEDMSKLFPSNSDSIHGGHICSVFIVMQNTVEKSDVLESILDECNIDLKTIFFTTYIEVIKYFLSLCGKDYKETISEFENDWKDYTEEDDETDEVVDSDVKKEDIDQSISNDEKEIVTQNTSLKDSLNELEELIGLEGVKKEIKSLINLIEISKLREKHGLKISKLSNHLVFLGNPGTGKTTVARLVAEIYHKIGVLSKGHLVEVDRSGLVGGYVGQTAIKVNKVIKKALGGILFIDEAYSLTYGKEDNDYGFEAVDTLLKGMEDNREDLVVIVAGYTSPMNQFLDSNPGLESRFNKVINFTDYNPSELYDIFALMCKKNDFVFSKEVSDKMKSYFVNVYENREENFANGRMVRNTFERIIQKQADRLSVQGDVNKKMLSCITLEDVDDL